MSDDQLPPEMWCYILTFLNGSESCKLSRVCRLFQIEHQKRKYNPLIHYGIKHIGQHNLDKLQGLEDPIITFAFMSLTCEINNSKIYVPSGIVQEFNAWKSSCDKLPIEPDHLELFQICHISSGTRVYIGRKDIYIRETPRIHWFDTLEFYIILICDGENNIVSRFFNHWLFNSQYTKPKYYGQTWRVKYYVLPQLLHSQNKYVLYPKVVYYPIKLKVPQALCF